jgi:hypothetical protein
MPEKRFKTLEDQITYRIARKKGDIILRKDFNDLSGYDQVGRVLRNLVKKGTLVRIGYGLYAKATKSPLSGKVVPRKSLSALAKEALSRLDVKVFPSSYDQSYNEGRTTQVPTGRVIAVKDRVSRDIEFNGQRVIFEKT